jgi:hypothetical protein
MFVQPEPETRPPVGAEPISQTAAETPRSGERRLDDGHSQPGEEAITLVAHVRDQVPPPTEE